MRTLAITDAAFVAAGWVIPLALLACYSVRTIRRGRALSERVPPEDRRWS